MEHFCNRIARAWEEFFSANSCQLANSTTRSESVHTMLAQTEIQEHVIISGRANVLSLMNSILRAIVQSERAWLKRRALDEFFVYQSTIFDQTAAELSLGVRAGAACEALADMMPGFQCSFAVSPLGLPKASR